MKIGTTQTLKFKKLQRRLSLPLWQATGLLESLWKMAYRNAPAGDIGRLSNEDIATAIEWESDADELVAALVETGWLDADPVHRLLIHDWEKECESWLRGNFEKHGKQFAQRTLPNGLATTNDVAQQPTKHPALQDSTRLLHSLPSLTIPSPAAAAPPPSLAQSAAAAAVNDAEWEQAKPLGNRLRKTLYPDKPKLTPDTWRWLAKVSILGIRYGPDWFEPAFEALKNGKAESPIALFTHVLDDECQRRQTRLNRELSRIEIPDEFLPKAP